MLARRVLVGEILQLVGKDQRGDLALRKRRADAAVDHMADLGGCGGLLDVSASDVLEKADEVEFLLVMRAEGTWRRPRP